MAGFRFESCPYQMAPLNFCERKSGLRFSSKAVLRQTLRNPQYRVRGGDFALKPFICYFSLTFSVLPDLQDYFPPSNDCKTLRKMPSALAELLQGSCSLKVEFGLRTEASYPKIVGLTHLFCSWTCPLQSRGQNGKPGGAAGRDLHPRI